MRASETEARKLRSTEIGEFTLLNSEKLGRVLDALEGISKPQGSEATAVAKVKEMKLSHEQSVLALYDRLGGAVKMDGRKLSIGTFFDFAAGEPRRRADFKEEDFDDEYVLVRKKTRKGKKTENPVDRIKRLESRAIGTKKTDEEVKEKPAKKTPKKTPAKKAKE